MIFSEPLLMFRSFDDFASSAALLAADFPAPILTESASLAIKYFVIPSRH